MGFFRRKQAAADSLHATVQIWTGTGGMGLEGVSVGWQGELSLVPHLPGAYWDKALANLSNMRREQDDLFRRFSGMLMEAARAVSEEQALSLAGLPGAPPDAGEPDATVTVDVTMLSERERLGAVTKFRPALMAQNPTVAEIGLWAIWDAVATATRDSEYRPMLAGLLYQVEYYKEAGLPGIRDIGRAPFYGATTGWGERLRLEQEQGENERLWAARPAADFMHRVHDRLADPDRAETMVRGTAVSEGTSLDLSGAETTDDDLDRLRQMPELEDLDLSGSSITDEGLVHLADLSALESLDLSETAITGRGLAHLRDSSVTYLNLSGSRITDDGLARFPQMHKLDHLDLSDSGITDEGLVHLANLPALAWLELLNTAVAGPGLAYLFGIPISYLNLAGSAITDDGLRHLSGLKRLHDLRLNETAVTDAGLVSLLDVASLEELELSDTAVTDAGVMKLLQHPALRIVEARNTRVGSHVVDAWRERNRLLRLTSEKMDPQLKAEMDQQVADDLFEQTSERFRGLYASEKNPTIGNDLSMALELMIHALGYKHDLADAESNDLWSLGSAGYAWRVAEGGGTGHAREAIKEAVAADFEPGHDRPYALMHAASGILKRETPIGLKSPGGFLYGRVFLRRGCEHAIEFIANPQAILARDHQEAAFYFGVALHDVERFVDELRAS